LSNNVVQNNSAYFAGDHAITINGTFTNTTAANRPLTNTLASGQKLTLNGDVFLSNLTGTGRVWQLRGSGETVINGDVMDFSGGKGTAASGIDFGTSGTGARSLTLAGASTYSGNTVLSGGASTLFVLAETGSMTFYIGADGVNNQITGSATAIFDGSFSFNLDEAVLADGNSWTIVDVATVIESFAGTFAVSGFSESGNVWTNGSGLSFDESTGILSYTAAAIPEPSAAALLAAAAGLLVAGGRRRRHNA
ncbi:MAG: PEP-CTERM sorting domain-containing protein, partial [Verrucomicrobiota bacterium]